MTFITACMLVAPLATAGEQSFTYWYTGSGFDTATDSYPAGEPDGLPVSVTTAVGKGSGVALVAITAEFTPDLLGLVAWRVSSPAALAVSRVRRAPSGVALTE